MTTINEARGLIYSLFITEWADQTPYDLDNEEFDIPDSVSWVRLVVRTKPSTPATLGAKGNRKFTRDASVMIQVFTPLDIGTEEGDGLSTTLRDMFEGTRLGDLAFLAADIQELGAIGEFYQYNIEAPFTYEELK